MKLFNNEPGGIKRVGFYPPGLKFKALVKQLTWADKAENRRDLGKTQESHPICAVLRTKSRD